MACTNKDIRYYITRYEVWHVNEKLEPITLVSDDAEDSGPSFECWGEAHDILNLLDEDEVKAHLGDRDALETKLKDLEKQRNFAQIYNASCKRGEPNTNFLTGEQRAYLHMFTHKNGELPAWMLGQLTKDINRIKKHLEEAK